MTKVRAAKPPKNVAPANYHVSHTEVVHMKYIYGLVFVYIVIMGLLIATGKISGSTTNETVKTIERMDASGGSIPSNMQEIFRDAPGPGQARVHFQDPKNIKLRVASANYPSGKGDEFRNLKSAVRKDGRIMPVQINGKEVDRSIIEMAIQDDKNFYPRTDEFPLFPEEQHFDSQNQGQRSMFNSDVQSPLYGPIGALGTG